jgi:hypothetical protein
MIGGRGYPVLNSKLYPNLGNLAIGQKNWLSTASTNVQTVALSSLAASLSPRFLSPAGLVWSLLIVIASPKEGLVQGSEQRR